MACIFENVNCQPEMLFLFVFASFFSVAAILKLVGMVWHMQNIKDSTVLSFFPLSKRMFNYY